MEDKFSTVKEKVEKKFEYWESEAIGPVHSYGAVIEIPGPGLVPVFKLSNTELVERLIAQLDEFKEADMEYEWCVFKTGPFDDKHTYLGLELWYKLQSPISFKLLLPLDHFHPPLQMLIENGGFLNITSEGPIQIDKMLSVQVDTHLPKLVLGKLKEKEDG